MWCKYLNLDSCIKCNENKTIHQGDGLCQKCYSYRRRRQKKKTREKKYEWSYDYPNCLICKTIDRPHRGEGLCERCSGRETYRKKSGYQPAKSGWSERYEACIKCKTIEIRYSSKGMCAHCYSKYRYTKPEYLAYKRDYAKSKSKEDIVFRLKNNLRSRLRMALKNNTKKAKTLDYLGCTIEELKTHLESQFKQGMSWGNYGLKTWHIDHVIPLDKFDLTKEEEIYKACHWTNLQPLWAKDNWSKQDKLGVKRH